jgi:hypothetical protein
MQATTYICLPSPVGKTVQKKDKKTIGKTQGTVAIFNTKIEAPLAPTSQLTVGGKEYTAL